MAWAALIPAAISAFSALNQSGGGDDGDAGGTLSRLQSQLPQYFEPYMQAGMSQLPQMESQYGQLMTDPGSKLNEIGGSYHQSPGFQFSVDQATQAANRAGATSGMAGSPAEQASLAKTVTGLSDQDYNQYLSHALGLYQQGLSGAGSLYGTGFNASKSLGEDLSSLGESQASLERAQEEGKQSGIAGLMGLGGSIFSSYMSRK